MPVVIVAPSQWALMDVSTCPIYREMFGEGVESRECDERAMINSIEDYPIVREQAGVMKCDGQIFVSPIPDVNDVESHPGRTIDVVPVSVVAGCILDVTVSDKGRVFTGTAKRYTIAFSEREAYAIMRSEGQLCLLVFTAMLNTLLLLMANLLYPQKTSS
jgi:hypothetical protein